MGASLSGVFSLQEFTDLGFLAAGFRLYTYAPSTTTLKVAYTDQAGLVPHTYTADGLGGQYIALNSRGELPAPLFLADGGYDVTLKTTLGVTIWTRRAIGGADDSNSLRADLANTSDPTKGAGLVGFDIATNYAAGSIGEYLKHSGATGLPFKRLKADYGAVGDGVTDDTAAYVAAIAALNEGAALVYDGYFRITDTVTVNKRLMHICFSAEQGIIVDVGTSKDGLVFIGTAVPLQLGVNGMDVSLNVYGKANSCKHAVVMTRADRSVLKFNIRAGATAYGLRVRGCLINEWDIDATSNYDPPASLPIVAGKPANGMVSDNYGVPTSAFTVVAVSGPAAPGVVTWAGHGFSADQPLVFSETGTAPPSPFTPGKPYFVRPVDANHFQLSETRSGTSITTTTAGTSPALATCSPIAPNDNDFNVNFEGLTGNGFVQAAVPGEGSNTLRGQIEGIGGSPFFVEDCLGFRITDLKMEFNGIGSTVKNALALEIGDGVAYLGNRINEPNPGDPAHPSTITLMGCRSYSIGDGFYGDLIVDNTNIGGKFGAIMGPHLDSFDIRDASAVQTVGFAASTDPAVLVGGPGHAPLTNIYHNGYADLFTANGAAAGPPDGATTTGFCNRANPAVGAYKGNPTATSWRCTQSGATLADAVNIVPTAQPWLDNDYVAVMIAVCVEAGNFGGIVFGFNGATNYTLGTVPADGQWHVVRAAFPLIAGNNWSIKLHNWDGAYHAAQLFYGGCNIVRGALPPSALADSLGRREWTSNSVAFAPPIVGMKAYAGGKWYLAHNTALATDWDILN